MGYELALEKSGCEIIDFKHFGSYQGTWLAFVRYNGELGIVEGSYGSCSGCDAFEAEFNYDYDLHEENGKYYKSRYSDKDNEITKEEYDKLKSDYDKKLIDFGMSYLVGGTYSKEHYQDKLEKINTQSEEDWFMEEEKEYCEWAVNLNWNQ